MTSRRGFLSALIAAGTAAAIDPERLLWTPGKKLVSIPKPSPEEWITSGEAIRRRETYLRDPESGLWIKWTLDRDGFGNVARARLDILASGILPLYPVVLGSEDFQAAALAVRGSSHRGIE